MELQDFIEKFATQFEAINASEITANTEFKSLDEWSSLMSMSIIALIKEEYGVTIKGKDIREAETIEDLFNIVKPLL